MTMLLATAAAIVLPALTLASVSIDGDFTDWQGQAAAATDPAGDATGGFDVTAVRALGLGSRLNVHFDIGQTLNYQSGLPGEGTLVIHLAVSGGGAVSFDCRPRQFTVNGAPASWTAVDFNGAPTYADDQFEMRFDLASVGAGPGSEVTVSFSGSDTVDPFTVLMGSPAPAPEERSPQRAAGTSFRIANLNTLQSGLTHPSRGPHHGALIDAVDADIYTFQEEWANSADAISTVLENVDPHGDGEEWFVRKIDGAVIASRSPLITMPSRNNRYAASIVDLPAGPVAIFSIHLKCCGHIGSPEDQQRLNETTDILATINDLRAGNLGPPLLPYAQAPAIIIGDWNLVGSRTPLTWFEEHGNVTRLDIEHLATDDIHTWRDASSSFTPGYLDVLAYGAGLTPRNRFVLETQELSSNTLNALGLHVDDSSGSDHLMVVADFTLGPWPVCPGDVTGDDRVDFADLNDLLEAWNMSVLPGAGGDLDGSGVVDFNDLNALLDAWGSECD